MPNYIKPTLTIVTNANGVTTDSGPTSIALNLTTTPAPADASGRIPVDSYLQGTLTTSTTPTELITDGVSAGISGHDLMTLNNATDVWAPGTDGGFLYLKNTDTSGTDSIYVGIVSNCEDNTGTCVGDDAPTAPHASNAGHLAGTDHETLRTMTLKPGEFAFFPWDYTGRIFVENNAGNPVLEWWLWDRG